MDEVKLRRYCSQLPKVELHAHLNGCVTMDCLRDLIRLKQRRHPQFQIDIEALLSDRSITGVFEMFAAIHSVIDSIEAVNLATLNVIRDFAGDNVKYLEIRSTPKTVAETNLTPENYIEAVIDGINAANTEGLDIVVKLIVSIDRRRSVKEAEETLRLVLKLRENSTFATLIVGLDLSGPPNVNDARMFLPVFIEAQRNGLKTTVHLAELNDKTEEILDVLRSKPHRIGHGTFLANNDVVGNEESVKLVLENKIPIEICLTSNVKTETVFDHKSHHIGYWLNKCHPVVICTDDSGVFETTLSNEYHLAAEHFNLNTSRLSKLAADAIDAAFCDESLKVQLRRKLDDFNNNFK